MSLSNWQFIINENADLAASCSFGQIFLSIIALCFARLCDLLE
jgi:hypothetical protein